MSAGTSPTGPRWARTAAAAALAAATLAGCATTYDETLVVDTTTATTTTLPTGTAPELLERLRSESYALAGTMIDGGDSGAAHESIVALWDASRDAVASDRPDLLDGFDRAIEMSRKAVQFKRVADADKAARNIDALVGAYLG